MQTLHPTDKDYWKQIVASSNRLGVRLLPDLQKPDNNGNVVISPTSIFVALTMLYNGSCAGTYIQLAQALGLPADDELNPWMRQLINFVNGHNQPDLNVHLYNSLWFQEGENLHEDFANKMTEVFSASLYGIDFKQRDAADRINAWISNATKGLIKDLVTIPPPSTKFVLTNAIYFKGKFDDPFKPEATQDGDFYLNGGGFKVTKVMRRTAHHSYYEDDDCQSILMTYAGGNYALHVVLPRKVQSPNFLLPRLEEILKKTAEAKMPTYVEFQLPKFEVSYRMEVQDALSNMGVRSLNDPLTCDLSRIRPKLVVDKIAHGATFKLDEYGTEASAATTIGGWGSGIPPQPTVMTVDRPFIYAISDKMTGQNLFMGLFMQPQ